MTGSPFARMRRPQVVRWDVERSPMSVSQIVMGAQLRRTGNTLHSILPDAA